VVELTVVLKKKISDADFKKFMKGDIKVSIDREIGWDDECVCADQGNFNGVILSYGGGEMIFVPNSHPWVEKLMEEDWVPGTHVYFPEIG
jgi:hypothetical protein